jgi:hypothetical protein
MGSGKGKPFIYKDLSWMSGFSVHASKYKMGNTRIGRTEISLRMEMRVLG